MERKVMSKSLKIYWNCGLKPWKVWYHLDIEKTKGKSANKIAKKGIRKNHIFLMHETE